MQNINKDKLKKIIINNRENFKLSKNLAEQLRFNRGSSNCRPIYTRQSDSSSFGERSIGSMSKKMKLRERFMVAVGALVTVFTIFLIVDLQMDIGLTGHHLVPSHGRVKFSGREDGPGAAYNSFRRRFLQKGNGSKESGAVQHGSATSQQAEMVEENRMEKSEVSVVTSKVSEQDHDDFKELQDFVMVRGASKDRVDGLDPFHILPGGNHFNPSLQQLLHFRPR